MSVKGFVSSGLGAKLLGGLGLAGVGAGVSVPITMEYFRGKDSPDVVASIKANHDFIQGVLDRTKRASEGLASQAALEMVSSRVEKMKELEKNLTESERNWRTSTTEYFSEQDRKFKESSDDLSSKVSNLKSLRRKILTEMGRRVPDSQSIGNRS